MNPTRLAVLATIGDLHALSAGYDLTRLSEVVAQVAPDFLCLEVTRQAWESGDLHNAPLPVHAALAPIAERSDMVVLPVLPSPGEYATFSPAGGFAAALERLHRWVQRRAAGPLTLNRPAYAAFCHTVCHLQQRAWSPEALAAWDAQNAGLAGNILEAIRQDPGRRALVVAQCQRVHQLEPALRSQPDVEFVPYWEL